VGRFSYSRWDGTQVGFDIDADAVLAEITDDLIHHGDVNAALRRMLQSGFEDREGNRVQGMRELMEKLRRERRERLENFDLGGVYSEIAEALKDVVDTERQGIEDLQREARESGDARRREVTDEVAAEKNMELDLLPPDLAGQVRELQQYEFASPEAREKFEELMEKLKQELANSYFKQISQGMENISPEDMSRMKTCWPSSTRCWSSGPAARSPTSTASWTSSVTSSRRTPRTSTSSSSRWPSAWRPCRRCSTR
jgi:uncharacterized protein with von Willebrand factor type A (vWA) domain